MPSRGSDNSTANLFAPKPAAMPEGTLTAHIDGGSRGNPGPSGYGVFLQDDTGRTVAELSEFLGVQTNNFAEYSALVAALEYALAHNCRSLQVIGDSELLVKQIKGIYKVRSESILDIYREAKQLIAKLDHFQVRHVLRHLNKDADRLANQAMDRGMKGVKIDRADAYARPPKAATPAPAAAPVKEVRGFVTGGAVQFTGEKLPDGIFVTIRPA
jgi:ribonuclease HI